MKLLRLTGLAAALGMLFAGNGWSQSASDGRPAVLLHVEGTAYLDGRNIEGSEAHLSEMREGSVLTTGEGRVKILVSPGVTLWLGEDSSVLLAASRVNESRIEMLTGTSFIVTDGMSKASIVKALCEDVATVFDGGVYRFDAHPASLRFDECRLKVYQGVADVRLATVNAFIKSGETMNVSRQCADMIPRRDFDVNDADRLDKSTGSFRAGWIVGRRKL